MAYSKIQFQPGINREGTAYDNEGGWFDGNLIRFRNGHVEKFGGWAKLGSNTLVGAGSVITKDIPDNMLAVERNKQVIIKKKTKKTK